jgi:hypothetical protein
MRLTSILIVVAVLAMCCMAFADAPEREVFIYRGTPLAQSGITVGSWGSGKASEAADTTKVLTGSKSIKIVTQGLYAGAKIDFSQPVSLYTDGVESNRYFACAFSFDAVETVNPGKDIYSYDIDPYQIPKVDQLRFVFVSDTGVEVEAVEQTNPLDPDDNWCRIAVPLAKFRGASVAKEFRLKKLLVFSSVPATFYLGEAKLVTDDSPIRVDPLSPQTVAMMDDVLFESKAVGGVSSLKYSWDYDSSNGIQDEANTSVGRITYTKGGDYTVTLTVSDADNVKAPVTVKTTISVID